MKMFFAILVLFSVNAMAANECAELNKCVEHVSKLTGKKYLFDGTKVKGSLQASSNLEITAENADTMLTYILDLNGYARVPTTVKDTYMIVESRDIRYQTIPKIEASAEVKPSFAQNYDYYSLNYKFKYHTQGQPRNTANSMRPFMSRYGRIVESGPSATLTVNDTADKLAQLYDVLKNNDREYTKEEVAKMKEETLEREQREERMDQREAKEKKAKKV